MALRIRYRWLAAAALLVAAARADAGLLPVSATVQQDGSNYRYTYGVVLTSDSTLKSGDFFTIYDFQGYIDGSAVAPDGFNFSVSNTGGTPAGTVPFDDPNKANLTWTYTGADISGQVGLGNFSLISGNAESHTGSNFTAQTHRQVDGKIDSNITETTVPGDPPIITPPDDGNGGGGEVPGVPEPASLALLGIGLPLAGALRYVRRQKA